MFKNSFGELRCGWAIALCIAVLTAAQFAASAIIGAMYALSLTDLLMQLTYIVGSALIITCVIILFKLLYKKPLAHMGFGMKRAAVKFFSGLLQGACYMAVVFVLLFAFGGLTIVSVSPARLLSADVVLWFFAFLVAALEEEVVCRGFMMTASKSTRSKAFIIFAPAIIFSLMHIMNSGFTVLPMLSIVLAGVLLAVIFVRSGSLWMPFGFHFAWNFFQGNVFGISVSGFEVESMIKISYTDFTLLNGGTFGAEGGLAAIGILALGIVLTWKFMKPAKDAQWSMEADAVQGNYLPPEKV